jgi:hypothetical protein
VHYPTEDKHCFSQTTYDIIQRKADWSITSVWPKLLLSEIAWFYPLIKTVEKMLWPYHIAQYSWWQYGTVNMELLLGVANGQNKSKLWCETIAVCRNTSDILITKTFPEHITTLFLRYSGVKWRQLSACSWHVSPRTRLHLFSSLEGLFARPGDGMACYHLEMRKVSPMVGMW